MFSFLTTARKREILTTAIDGLQGKMLERGSLSSNAEKLGKEILRAFRDQVTSGQPTVESKNLLFTFTTDNNTGQMHELKTLLAKEGTAKSITDLNAAFDGKIIIEKNENGTYIFTLKVPRK